GAIAALCRDKAQLGHMPTDRIRQHRSLANEKLPAAMQHQARLLLLRLRRDKSHRRPCNRLADGGSVVGVILAALEVGLHVARRHQLHRMAERLKAPAPIMCGRARLNSYEAARQCREEFQDLRSADALADDHRAMSIHAVNLKNRLRYIETDRANLAHGRLPSSGWFRRSHLRAFRCRRVGAVHSIKSADLAVSASGPLMPQERPQSGHATTSHSCQFRTHALRQTVVTKTPDAWL